MSRKEQTLTLYPLDHDNSMELSEFNNFACPACSGRGWMHDWDAKRDDPHKQKCERCNGSGRLRASVIIKWMPDVLPDSGNA